MAAPYPPHPADRAALKSSGLAVTAACPFELGGRFKSALMTEAASAAERVNQNDGFPSGPSAIQVDPCALPPLRLMRAHPTRTQ